CEMSAIVETGHIEVVHTASVVGSTFEAQSSLKEFRQFLQPRSNPQTTMANSYSFILDPRWGVSLDKYLESSQPYSLAKYPVERVLSAIKTITTNDPPELISDTTLEAVLSVAYYPEQLKALDLEFCAPFYEILGTYLDHGHTVRRSFGVLLKQVHGMSNMVEFLVVHHKLSAFVESLARSQIRGVDVLHGLSREVVQLTGLDKGPSMGT
ncbi:hypothetical protein BDV93DRAFT_517067, partial [Ceratobasidium sp. AG-I]